MSYSIRRGTIKQSSKIKIVAISKLEFTLYVKIYTVEENETHFYWYGWHLPRMSDKLTNKEVHRREEGEMWSNLCEMDSSTVPSAGGWVYLRKPSPPPTLFTCKNIQCSVPNVTRWRDYTVGNTPKSITCRIQMPPTGQIYGYILLFRTWILIKYAF